MVHISHRAHCMLLLATDEGESKKFGGWFFFAVTSSRSVQLILSALVYPSNRNDG
jgi:membrane glycosyltransferase